VKNLLHHFAFVAILTLMLAELSSRPRFLTVLPALLFAASKDTRAEGYSS
jgi:hypothetical protein